MEQFCSCSRDLDAAAVAAGEADDNVVVVAAIDSDTHYPHCLSSQKWMT